MRIHRLPLINGAVRINCAAFGPATDSAAKFVEIASNQFS